ncbi:MAG: UDP-N-acetylglucosamine 1-carboxyvinyltransferase [Ruminococcaceae bacterium]|jgi:UDP-N-acetylglucosamine 1-carboxyvinyltransferase|nr:UDP-N-acetylglucosamine 1-carboxyvinyltransferase [Oscillospiraceae bacterium]
MQELVIEGGCRLQGELTIQGSKNGVLPVLAATILCAGECRVENCPRLRDVDASIAILRHLGCCTRWEGGALLVDTTHMDKNEVPDALMREMRSSVIFLGAILARQGEAALSYPGGCELGPRPIDMHLAALRALGAEIEERGGTLRCRARVLTATEIVLPLPSVGATENAILAACGAEGTTAIYNAAREPEIAELQDFLNAMGAQVCGAGGSIVTVTGKRALHGGTHRVIGDRIAAATYLCAAAACGGEVRLSGVDCRALSPVTAALYEAGCAVESGVEDVFLRSGGRLRAIHPVRTAPYPGFPTDAQPAMMAALLRSAGSTVFVENIFENRYRHAGELSRMGADIRVAGRVAVVSGVPSLHGASVKCTDLRGGAALVLAGLQAEGTTRVSQLEHIDRGYESMERELALLGARIGRREETQWQERGTIEDADGEGTPSS